MKIFYTLTIQDYYDNVYYLTCKKTFEKISYRDADFGNLSYITKIGEELIDKINTTIFDLKTLSLIKFTIEKIAFPMSNKNILNKG